MGAGSLEIPSNVTFNRQKTSQSHSNNSRNLNIKSRSLIKNLSYHVTFKTIPNPRFAIVTPVNENPHGLANKPHFLCCHVFVIFQA